MKKIYNTPALRAIEIDMQNIIANSLETNAEPVNVEGEDIKSLSRDNNSLWDAEW